HRTLQAFQDPMERVPAAFHQMLLALDYWLGPRMEIVLAGSSESERGCALRNTVNRAFLPRAIVAQVDAQGTEAAGAADARSRSASLLAPELVAGESPVGGMPAAYVCRNFTCDAPCTDPDELRARLAGGSACARRRGRIGSRCWSDARASSLAGVP